MSRTTGLNRRKGSTRLQFRRRWPTDVVHLLPGEGMAKSTGLCDPDDARRRFRELEEEYDRLVDDARLRARARSHGIYPRGGTRCGREHLPIGLTAVAILVKLCMAVGNVDRGSYLEEPATVRPGDVNHAGSLVTHHISDLGMIALYAVSGPSSWSVCTAYVPCPTLSLRRCRITCCFIPRSEDRKWRSPCDPDNSEVC